MKITINQKMPDGITCDYCVYQRLEEYDTKTICTLFDIELEFIHLVTTGKTKYGTAKCNKCLALNEDDVVEGRSLDE